MTRASPPRALAVLAMVVACGAPPPTTTTSSAPPPTTTTVQGPVAATVDGEPIALSEVEATARQTGLSPLAALHRLEQERVLWARAQRAALGQDAEADDAARRASVQALLRARVEDAIGPDDITPAEIATRYEASRSSWARPERRASLHVLAAVPAGADAETTLAAATRFIRAAIPRLAAAQDPEAEAHALEAEASGRTFTVTVESIPATARHGALEEPYLAALFSIASAPGVAPEPVTTSFGIHAVVLTSVEPRFELSLAEAAPILRRQLVTEHRGAALEALAADLASHTTVAIDERAAAGVFTADLDDARRTP